ncbi:MAG: glycosyltransferase [Phycisphaerales bacterium]|nr:glycosyltransferase [Phycisphaerales bacterium]
MPTLFAIVPVYNEPDTLDACVARVLAQRPCAFDVSVILVNDGSNDATRRATERVAASSARVTLLVHPKNRGKGAAIRTGFAEVLARMQDDDLVLIHDADAEYDPADWNALLARQQETSAGLTLGNRWAHGVPNTAHRRIHRLANGLLTLASNLTTGVRVADMECCTKLFTRAALQCIAADLDEDRFGIEPQIVSAAARHSIKIAEAPVTYAPRGFQEGKKIRAKDGVRVFVVLARERFRTWQRLLPSMTGKRAMLQLVGFLLGCALVVWCARRAFEGGTDGIAKLRDADPFYVCVLLASTLGSILCGGFTFWSVARPLRRFSVVEMQAVNLMASLFNYAPIRLGLLLRCMFHWRVDRMSAIDIGAWIAGVAIVTLGALGSALAAGLIQIPFGRSELALDWLWFATYAACIILGSAVTLLIGRAPLLRRFLKGGERVLTSPRALAESLAFRTVDLSMWTLRMWAAAKIVGVELHPAQAALLAAVAILGAGNPLGRIGWREAIVALVAPYVITIGDSKESLDALTSQLALLESAGEAAITIPLGILGTIWCAAKMRRARTAPFTANFEGCDADRRQV